jgi:type II secretory pathway predicted ATPase ExeA
VGEVRGNYSARTRHAIENMLRGFTPGKAGQLILWTGELGTGKTWAIRALAWEWQRWCRLHYIADPEQLLGQRSR